MAGIFGILNKIKPVYDQIYKITLFLCKMLLIADILVATLTVAGRYIPFIPDPAWSEEVILSCMAYMTVLSGALAIRRRAHIRMTAFDKFLPEKLVTISDVISDIAVLVLAIVLIVVGWRYSVDIGSKGSYVSMPNVSRFWMYFAVPLGGIAMLIFQIEVLLENIEKLFAIKEEI